MSHKNSFKRPASLLAIIFLALPLMSFANKAIAASPLPDRNMEKTSQESMILRDDASETIEIEKNKDSQELAYNGYVNSCSGYIKTDGIYNIGVFANNMLYVFAALLLWVISPIGILFFLAARILFSKKSSKLKRKIAWVIQGIAILLWASAITLFLIIYLDSISFKIFNLGGSILNIAVFSGFAFALIMFLFMISENRIKTGRSGREGDGEKKRRENGDTNKKEDGSENEDDKNPKNNIKAASIEFGGVKEKIKRKIKQDLKEIVDEEIDKRL